MSIYCSGYQVWELWHTFWPSEALSCMFQEDQLGLSLLTLEQLQSDEMQNKLTQRAHSLMWGTKLTHFVTHSRHTHYCDTQGETRVRYRVHTLSCDTHQAWRDKGGGKYHSQYMQVIQPLVPKTVSDLQQDPCQKSVLYTVFTSVIMSLTCQTV